MDERMFDLMSKMYTEMQDLKGEMQEGFKRLDTKIDNVDARVEKLEQSVVRIEIEHGKKLDALFDGYKQNSEQLTRIENEVKRHDEVILRRVN